MDRTCFYVNIYGSYKLLKTVPFLAHPVQYSTYFASFAVYDGHVFPTFRQPLADVDAEFSDEFYARRIVVVKRKPLNAAAKPRSIVSSLRTSNSKQVINYYMLWLAKLQFPTHN